jgi:hypothetical protein
MSLFNFFRKKKLAEVVPSDETIGMEPDIPDIPRHLFIEENEPVEMDQQDQVIRNQSYNQKNYTIHDVYDFMQKDDFEKRGYEDALSNPDESNKKAGIEIIKEDLKILISRVSNELKKDILSIDSHINSRSRAGLVDLVEELKSKKESYINDINYMNEIKDSIEKDSGMFSRILLSYSRGFMKGISELSNGRFL